MSQTDAGATGQDNPGAPPGPYRSLFDRLRTLAEHLPVSHVVSDTAHGRFLGALAHYAEFGDQILDAADSVVEHIADQLHNVAPAQRKLSTHVAEVIAAPYPQPDGDDAAVSAQLASLQQQIAALQAERVNLTSTAVSEPAPANPAGVGGADATAALQAEQANQPPRAFPPGWQSPPDVPQPAQSAPAPQEVQGLQGAPTPQAYPPAQSAPDQPPAPPSPPAPDQTGGNA